MKHLISLVSAKGKTGKTVLGMRMAAALSRNYKTVFIECGDLVYDAAAYSAQDRDFKFDSKRKMQDFLEGKTGCFYCCTEEKNIKECIEYWEKKTDIIILEPGAGIKDLVTEVSDSIGIVMRLNRNTGVNLKAVLEHMRKEDYPSSMTGLIINYFDENFLPEKDVRETYGNINIWGFVKKEKNLDLEEFPGTAVSKAEEKIFEDIGAEALRRASTGRFYTMEKRKNEEAAENVAEEKEKTFFAGKAEKDRQNREMKKKIREKLYEEMDVRRLEKDAMSHPEKKAEIFSEIKRKIQIILDRECGGITDKAARQMIVSEVYYETAGLGAIESFLSDPEITEIMVNNHEEIYIEKKGKLIKAEKTFTDNSAVIRAIERIVMPLGRRIDESMPYVDARLPDGSRVNAIIPPLALDGPVVTIRKFSDKKLSINDLIEFGSITKESGQYLAEAVENKKNIIISGGTGSGKTTLLNIASSFIPADERIVTIEDSAELRLTQEHVVRLESRPPNIEGRGEVNIRDLVKNALRMRPDRIVVGECRGGETLDMLQAMNTGHEGSMTTVHANSPRDALSRIEVMVLLAGIDLPLRAIREQIRSAVDIIVQQSRMKDGSRKVTHIAEITGMEGDTILMHNVFERKKTPEGITGELQKI
ncbi:MAG: ATPase, T2SS/T4P/T4SS family [Candidatus Goldiibacteriota bacterium]